MSRSSGFGARLCGLVVHHLRPATGSEFGYLLRFLLVGVLNTFVGLGTIYACKYFLSLGDVPANVIGYLVGLTNSFFWNRRWTFSQSGDSARTIARFSLVFMAAYLANLSVMLILKHFFRVDAYVAHAIATIPYTALFYLGSRHFVFVKDKGPVS